MERLGIYIIYLFFLAIVFFERVRTRGDTGSIWRVLFRNLLIATIALVGFFLAGYDVMFPAPQFEGELFRTAKSIIYYEPPYGEIVAGARFQAFKTIWLDCLRCVSATLIAAVGIWELRFRKWIKWALTLVFSLFLYPVFGLAQGGAGFLGGPASRGGMGYYDYGSVLLIYTLPAAFVLGARLMMPKNVLPEERRHDLKGVKILPGMKHRFFLSRGVGFMMIFLVLHTPPLKNLPLDGVSEYTLFALSKPLTLIPASFTILFCSFFFFAIFGRNKGDRPSYAPPFFAVMAVMVSAQSCDTYSAKEVILASIITTFLTLFYLRAAPLKIRIWDPLCSTPIFLVGGICGALACSLNSVATFGSQFSGVAACLIFGGGIGALLTLGLRSLRLLKTVDEDIADPIEDLEPLLLETTPDEPKKRFKLFRKKQK